MSNVLSEYLAGPKAGQVRVEGLAHISKTMASSSRMHYIYLLRCADNSLYVGETSNLQTRDGLVAIYKDGPVFEVVAIDSAGRTRPDWAAAIRQRPLRAYPWPTNETATLTGQAWSVVLANSSTRRVVRTRSRPSCCDRRGRGQKKRALITGNTVLSFKGTRRSATVSSRPRS